VVSWFIENEPEWDENNSGRIVYIYIIDHATNIQTYNGIAWDDTPFIPPIDDLGNGVHNWNLPVGTYTLLLRAIGLADLEFLGYEASITFTITDVSFL